MRNIKCSNCGAGITAQDDNRDFIYCQYCGSKIMLDDYRETHRIVDEAAIKHEESEEKVRLRILELEESKLKVKRKYTIIKILISLFLLILGIVLLDKDDFSFGGIFSLYGAVFVWAIGIKNDKK